MGVAILTRGDPNLTRPPKKRVFGSGVKMGVVILIIGDTNLTRPPKTGYLGGGGG